jgi:hypothetical protein
VVSIGYFYVACLSMFYSVRFEERTLENHKKAHICLHDDELEFYSINYNQYKNKEVLEPVRF